MTLKRNFQKLKESPGVRYESVGRGFESLPSHQEKPEHVCVLVFLFVSTMEGARTGRRRAAPQAISPVQQRRPQPAAETGRSCWGRVLIFLQLLGRALKNQNAATTPPCFSRWLRSSSLLFESSRSRKKRKAQAQCAWAFLGATGRIRTSGLPGRSRTLYPAELRSHEG